MKKLLMLMTALAILAPTLPAFAADTTDDAPKPTKKAQAKKLKAKKPMASEVKHPEEAK